MNFNSVLQVRNSKYEKGREIYFLNDDSPDGENLNQFISTLVEKTITDQDILPYRLGILYKFISGHVTPLLIEYYNDSVFDESDNDSSSDQIHQGFRIYSTDSRAYDLQNGDELKQVILNLPTIDDLIEVFALGLDDDQYEAKMNTIRQHTDNGCATFSLVDLEIMLRVFDLHEYFMPNIKETSTDRCFQITKLPPNMMFYCQSIHGNDLDNRRGLKHYIEDNNQQAHVEFALFQQTLSMQDIFSVEGYLAMINGLSAVKSPISVVDQAVKSGYKDELLQVGKKTISLQALYNWHLRHDQQSFMIDMFNIIYTAFSNNYNGCHVNDEASPYYATAILNNQKIADHALFFNEYGPKTNLIPFEEEKNLQSELDSIDQEYEPSPIDEEMVFNSVITLFARTVFSRTPNRKFLTNPDEPNLLRETPSSRKQSPEMPPANGSFEHSSALESSSSGLETFTFFSPPRNQANTVDPLHEFSAPPAMPKPRPHH